MPDVEAKRPVRRSCCGMGSGRVQSSRSVFAMPELPRVALAILREVGDPLPIRVIAARALALKDCHAPTRRIFKMTRVRLQQLFGLLDEKGITYSVGTGGGTQRGLRPG